jgi:hypothetical protein
VISVSDTPLHFIGPPRRITAVFRGRLEEFEAPVVEFGAEKLSARIKPLRDTDATEIVFALPRTTAPGTYEAHIHAGGRGQLAIVEVQPWEQSKAFPPSMFLQTRPGGRESISLTLTNIGNTSIEVSRVTAFVLAQSEAVCHSIVATAAADLHNGHQMIDRFAQELNERFGGVAKIHVKTAECQIESGKTHDIDAELRIPDKIKPGKEYWGFWSIYPRKAYTMRVQIDAP